MKKILIPTLLLLLTLGTLLFSGNLLYTTITGAAIGLECPEQNLQNLVQKPQALCDRDCQYYSGSFLFVNPSINSGLILHGKAGED